MNRIDALEGVFKMNFGEEINGGEKTSETSHLHVRANKVMAATIRT